MIRSADTNSSSFGDMTSRFMMTVTRLSEPSKPKWQPDKVQKNGVKFLLENQNAGLLYDPGLGKTSIALSAHRLLRKHKTAKGMLVIGPLRPCYMVWPYEIDKWADFEDTWYTILHGDHKDRNLEAGADVMIMNFEGIEWLFGTPKPKMPNTQGLDATAKEVVKQKFKHVMEEWNEEHKRVKQRLEWLFEHVDVLCIDELTKLKHAQTGRFQCLKPHLHRFRRRWGLTGSPASESLLDLFGQCYVLDEGGCLGRYITHYRQEYFMPTGYGGYVWVPQEGAEERIYKAIAPLMLRAEATDLPDKIDNIIRIELDPKSRALYDELEDEFFVEIDSKGVSAKNAGSRGTKLAQIASGGVYTDAIDEETGIPYANRGEWSLVHNLKTEAMLELMDELQGQQLFIAYHYQHDLDRIVKALTKGTKKTAADLPILGVSLKRDMQIERDWNQRKIPYVLGHPQSVGHGLNMQESGAHNIFWYTLTYSFELYDQLNRRLRRRNSKAGSIFVHHCVARGTIDEVKLNALRSKYRGQEALFKALKEYRAAKRRK